MRKYFLVAIILSVVGSANGQDRRYHWEDDRKPTELSASEKEENVLQLLSLTRYDYTYENGELILYHTVHSIVRVNNDEAIAQNNRIYIPLMGAIDLTEIHARTIRKDGSVVLLDKENIKEVEDEESGNGYKIFAIEGAEIGSEIEYYYTLKRYARYFGRYFFQGRNQVKSVDFVLTSPENLKFTFKSYNGFPEVEEVTQEGVNAYQVKSTDIPALPVEDFSAYNDNRQRLEFKLTYNTAHSRGKILTWADAGKSIIERNYVLDKQEEKALEKWLNGLKLDKYPEADQPAVIEDAIKTGYLLDETDASSPLINDIIEQKVGNEAGYTRMMANALKMRGIDHEIVITSDRTDISFDGDFESYNYLDSYLIHIMKSREFMAPGKFQYRIGLVPAEFTATEGLFVGRVEHRGEIFPVAQVREIPAHDYHVNFDKLDLTVTFDEALTANEISLERSFSGYTSSFIKTFLPLMDEAQKDELLTDFIRYVSPDADFKTKELVSAKREWNEWKSPLVIRGTMNSSHFIENAGSTILFNAGQLIGAQSELYQETERKTRVMNEYNRGYLRTLTIHLPEGYEVQNLDELDMSESAQNNAGEDIFLFKSSYAVEGNVLTVTIDEFYNQIYVNADRFEEFRKVINAAADFNKIVLVMKKQQSQP